MRLAGYELWKSKASGNSACDYAFHMSVTQFVSETESQLREIVADGIAFVQDFPGVQEFLWR